MRMNWRCSENLVKKTACIFHYSFKGNILDCNLHIQHSIYLKLHANVVWHLYHLYWMCNFQCTQNCCWKWQSFQGLSKSLNIQGWKFHKNHRIDSYNDSCSIHIIRINSLVESCRGSIMGGGLVGGGRWGRPPHKVSKKGKIRRQGISMHRSYILNYKDLKINLKDCD